MILVSPDIGDDGNFDHLVKVVSAGFLHCKVTIIIDFEDMFWD